MALFSIICVTLCFVIGTILPINLGVIGFVFSFLMILVADLPVKSIYDQFIISHFFVIAGVTYMFTLLNINGTINHISNFILKSVRGQKYLLPWTFFIAGAVLGGVGPGPSGAMPILAPTVMGISYRAGINLFLSSVMLMHGTFAGTFTGLTALGIGMNSVMVKAGFDINGILLRDTFIANALVVLFTYLCFGGLKLIRESWAEKANGKAAFATEEEEKSEPINLEQKISLLFILVLIVATIAFKLNVGLTAFTLGFILCVLFKRNDSVVIKAMPWGVFVLIMGCITIVGIMDKLKGTQLIVETITTYAPPSIAPLFLIMSSALVSFYANSIATLATFVPIGLQLMESIGATNLTGMLVALTIASTVVDNSPLALQGALCVANAKPEDSGKLSKKLLMFGFAIIPVGSIVAWLLCVVIGIY